MRGGRGGADGGGTGGGGGGEKTTTPVMVDAAASTGMSRTALSTEWLDEASFACTAAMDCGDATMVAMSTHALSVSSSLQRAQVLAPNSYEQ